MIDIYHQLHKFGIRVDIVDPQAHPEDVESEYGISSSRTIPNEKYDAVIFAVPHKEFLALGKAGLEALSNSSGFVYYIKQVFYS